MLENFIKNKKQVYWICQIGGWTSLALLNFLFSYFFQEFHDKKLNIYLFLFLPIVLIIFGISSTHFLRKIIKKNNWIFLPIKKLLPKIFLSTFLIALFISAVLFLVFILIKFVEYQTLNLVLYAIWTFNLFVFTLIWNLIYYSVHIFENFNRSEIERLVWEAAVKDFELKTLKSQLNPHFMFNALNSIRALIEENPERAKSAITQLSNIFRYSLRIERVETVPLDEEMRTVTDYLALEHVRFEERLRYKINVDPATKNIEIPPMMIQTLVENGIKHGISKIQQGGEIEVTTSIQNSTLIITINNSGNFSEQDLLNAKGFGISATKQRLNLLYDEKATFKIYNQNESVIAEIKIPIGG